MNKILALDPGDVHVGTAISDELHITASPCKTIKPNEIIDFIKDAIEHDDVAKVIIGYPKTMRGTISSQTQKSIDLKNDLEKKFPSLTFILWDERLTSKSAGNIKRPKNKTEKLHQHSIAAAIILQTYLDSALFL